MSDDVPSESCYSGGNVQESSSSQSMTTAVTTPSTTVNPATPAETVVSAGRPHTKRGRALMKWVGLNYEEVEKLKEDNGGNLPEELTNSPFPHSDEWSEENLPEILFFIKPPKSDFEGKPVKTLMENGNPIKAWGQDKFLSDFPILPRRISLNVPGWLIEAWRRLDPRITYGDILDRQIADPAKGLKKLDKNALQNHCRRECRMILNMWSGYDRRQVPHRTHVEAIEDLSYQNIMLNTILDVCPSRQDRLTKIRFVRRSLDGKGRYYAEPCEVKETNVHKTTFPIDHFVLKSGTTRGVHVMDSAMLAAWELCLILQERARIHGLSHWKLLDKSCRPVSWFDRTVNKRSENDTFDGGCSVCTWTPGRDQLLHKEWMDAMKSTCSEPTGRKLSAAKSPSSQVPKKRKRGAEKRENVPEGTRSELAEDCYCCKEAASSQGSGSTSEHYPSEQFRNGKIISYFRDANDDEGALVDSVMDSEECGTTEERVEGDQAAEHNGASGAIEQSESDQVAEHSGANGAIEQSTKHSGVMSNPHEQEWNYNFESPLVPLTTPPLPQQDFDTHNYHSTKSDFNNIGPHLPHSSTTESDLNGIGSHLTIMGGGEFPPQHTPNRATLSSGHNMDETLDGGGVKVIISENYGENWNQNLATSQGWNVASAGNQFAWENPEASSSNSEHNAVKWNASNNQVPTWAQALEQYEKEFNNDGQNIQPQPDLLLTQPFDMGQHASQQQIPSLLDAPIDPAFNAGPNASLLQPLLFNPIEAPYNAGQITSEQGTYPFQTQSQVPPTAESQFNGIWASNDLGALGFPNYPSDQGDEAIIGKGKGRAF